MRYEIHILYTIAFCFPFILIAQEKKEPLQPQYNNSIILSTGNFHVFNRINQSGTINIIGVSYRRRIINSLFIEAGFAKWQSFSSNPDFKDVVIDNNDFSLDTKIGDLSQRTNYKIIDLIARYAFTSKSNKHRILPGLGFTYYWGNNSYVTRYHVNPAPPYDVLIFTGNENVGSYIGMTPILSYSYNLFKDRVCIGTTYQLRIFPGKLPTQQDLLLNIGVNF